MQVQNCKNCSRCRDGSRLILGRANSSVILVAFIFPANPFLQEAESRMHASQELGYFSASPSQCCPSSALAHKCRKSKYHRAGEGTMIFLDITGNEKRRLNLGPFVWMEGAS